MGTLSTQRASHSESSLHHVSDTKDHEEVDSREGSNQYVLCTVIFPQDGQKMKMAEHQPSGQLFIVFVFLNIDIC